MGQRAGDSRVGAFFYDPDLAKFGNAISPIVSMPYDRAVRAMSLPFEDRYGPRLDAPTWSDYMAMGESSMGESRVGGFFDAFEEQSGIKRGSVVASVAIAGLTVLFISREPRRAVEFGALGAAGVVLSLYLGAKR